MEAEQFAKAAGAEIGWDDDDIPGVTEVASLEAKLATDDLDKLKAKEALERKRKMVLDALNDDDLDSSLFDTMPGDAGDASNEVDLDDLFAKSEEELEAQREQQRKDRARALAAREAAEVAEREAAEVAAEIEYDQQHMHRENGKHRMTQLKTE